MSKPSETQKMFLQNGYLPEALSSPDSIINSQMQVTPYSRNPSTTRRGTGV